MKKLLQAHLALFLVNLLYAANHLIAKGVMPKYISPNTFILFRVVGATVLFWCIKGFLPKERIERKDLKLVALCALFGIAINQLFFFHGLNLSSSINSGIIMTLNPLMVALVAWLLMKQKVGKIQLVGMLLATVGAVFLTLMSNNGSASASLGDILLFINAFSYAIYLVIAKPLMQKYSPFTVITYTFTFGSLYLFLFPPTWTDLFSVQWSSIPSIAWWKITYVVIGVSFLTYLLTMFGLKYLSATVSAAYIYIQPVFVIVFAFLFVQIGLTADYTNTITWMKLAFMVLILAGVSLINFHSLFQGKQK